MTDQARLAIRQAPNIAEARRVWNVDRFIADFDAEMTHLIGFDLAPRPAAKGCTEPVCAQ